MSKTANPSATRRMKGNGRRMVLLEEGEYERLRQKADEWEPVLPEANADGNYPAAETAAVIQAQNILRAHRKLGLSQAELARRAGIRQTTVNRIEQAENPPSVPTIIKIVRTLKAAAKGNS